MIFILFLIGILAIFSISRYNESNKLFWTLFFSYIGMFTVGTIVVKATSSNERNKIYQYQVSPTQVDSTASSSTCYLGDVMFYPTVTDSTDPVLVSQAYIPDFYTGKLISNEDRGRSRDQPIINNLRGSPNSIVNHFDTS